MFKYRYPTLCLCITVLAMFYFAFVVAVFFPTNAHPADFTVKTPLSCKTYAELTGIIADARDNKLPKEQTLQSTISKFDDILTYDDRIRLPKLIDMIYDSPTSSAGLKFGVMEECTRQTNEATRPRYI